MVYQTQESNIICKGKNIFLNFSKDHFFYFLMYDRNFYLFIFCIVIYFGGGYFYFYLFF